MMLVNIRKTLFITAFGILSLAGSFAVDNALALWAGSSAHPVLIYFFGWISYALSLLVVLLLMTSMFMWEERKQDWIIPLWFSFIFTLALVFILKFIVQRDRPFGQEMSFLGLADYSFPSAHAAAAFSTIAILDEEYPMFKWFWIAFAVLIALSRIYLGYHFPSDVIAGALLGYLISVAVVYLKKRHSLFR